MSRIRNRGPRQPLSRQSQIARARSKLEREHFPRIQMGWIVTMTGLTGLTASFLLLHAGVLSMGPRYFYAMCVAYLTFLLLLWGWLRLRGESAESADLPDIDIGGRGPAFEGHGGSFDGGGASGDYDAATSGAGDALSGVDAGDAVIPLAVLALVLGIALSSLFVIYSAPTLFAELLVDGVLSASLYRRLAGLDRRHWLESALRRTVVPFVLTALFVAAAGWGMGVYAPEAHSIGQVVQHSRAHH